MQQSKEQNYAQTLITKANFWAGDNRIPCDLSTKEGNEAILRLFTLHFSTKNEAEAAIVTILEEKFGEQRKEFNTFSKKFVSKVSLQIMQYYRKETFMSRLWASVFHSKPQIQVNKSLFSSTSTAGNLDMSTNSVENNSSVPTSHAKGKSVSQSWMSSLDFNRIGKSDRDCKSQDWTVSSPSLRVQAAESLDWQNVRREAYNYYSSNPNI